MNGAWEAGVLYGLIKYGPKEEYQWDVVSGISIGCVNSSGVAIWDKGNEEQMVEWMSNVWDTLKTTDIYQSWGWVPGVSAVYSGINREAIFDTSPGMEYLKKLTRGPKGDVTGFKRRIVCDAVDSETGIINSITENDIPFEEYYKVVLASASVPGFFPNTEIEGHRFMDGMAGYNTDVEAAIKRC